MLPRSRKVEALFFKLDDNPSKVNTWVELTEPFAEVLVSANCPIISKKLIDTIAQGTDFVDALCILKAVIACENARHRGDEVIFRSQKEVHAS